MRGFSIRVLGYRAGYMCKAAGVAEEAAASAAAGLAREYAPRLGPAVADYQNVSDLARQYRTTEAAPVVRTADALPAVWGKLTPEQCSSVIGQGVHWGRLGTWPAAAAAAAFPAATTAGRVLAKAPWLIPITEGAEMVIDYSGKGQRAYERGRYVPPDPEEAVDQPRTWLGKTVSTAKHLWPAVRPVFYPVDTLASAYDQTYQNLVAAPMGWNAQRGWPVYTAPVKAVRNAAVQLMTPLAEDPRLGETEDTRAFREKLLAQYQPDPRSPENRAAVEAGRAGRR